MKAFLIIGYSGHGWSYILNCYFSLRKYDNETTVIIINDKDEPLHEYLKNEVNLRYKTNKLSCFELGCIKNAVYSYADIEQFFIIHDSCVFIDSIPEFTKDIMFFESTLTDIAPSLDEIKQWCELYFPDIIYNKIDNIMCQGLMGCFSREMLLKVFEYGLKYVNVKYKHEAVSSEGLFGIMLKQFNPNIETYHPYKINEYITNTRQWLFLKKHAIGRGLCIPFDKMINTINKTDLHHPEQKRNFEYKGTTYDSLLSCIALNFDNIEEVVFKYYHKNHDLLLLVVDKRANKYQVENDYYGIGIIYYKMHHNFYILKHFKEVRDYENLELEDMRNGNYLQIARSKE
jgi:hypothetical protein